MIPLPIDRHLGRIVEAVRERSGVVLVAEPGAGKTTRVPRALLDAGMEGEILVVEPRRLAARMAARRVAEELGEAPGERIGHRVRFESRVSSRTRVTFVTEGILSRRLAADPRLDGVGVLVFDELHERHLDADVALALARRIREERALSIVAMSATLDAAPVAAFLDAPIIEVEGRAYPVEQRHVPAPDDRPLERRVRAAVVRLIEDGLEGDVLVFLPGAAEIRRSLDALSGPAGALGFDLLPLHGDLPAAEQDRAVRPGPRRKVVLSTNVAETSLTIDGVAAVVDSGLARVARHSPWTGLSSLETAKISRASATQRAGRAGRTRAGVCVRLYTRRDHDARPERDAPEIERAELSAMVLALRGAGHDPARFEFLEAPPASALAAADELLDRLGATSDSKLTELGRAMRTIPAHPRLARVALEAARRGHVEGGAMLAALLGERDVRRRARARFGGGPSDSDEVGASDLIASLETIEGLGPRASAGSLRAHDLEPRTVATVRKAQRQIAGALGRVRLAGEPTFDEEEALLIATLSGFPDRVARRRAPRGLDLVFAGGGGALLDEASVVKEAELLVALDVGTARGRPIVRRASAVQLEHLMELYLDRLVDTREVRFEPERERVVASMTLRYDGLVIERKPIEPTDEEAAAVLAAAALERGVERFVDDADALDALRRRLRFARRFDETLPALDDAHLAVLLTRLAEGRRSFAELRGAGLMEWIEAELGRDARARLDALAPMTIAIPGRARVPVHYEIDRPPWIESRLHDFFGATDGPRVASGEVAVLLHLQAPNGRAVQITDDLAGFWDRHYLDVRKELRGRYPRHPWPDDPRTAKPGRPRRRRR